MKEAIFSFDFPVFFFWVSVYTCQASKSHGTWFVSAKLFKNLKLTKNTHTRTKTTPEHQGPFLGLHSSRWCNIQTLWRPTSPSTNFEPSGALGAWWIPSPSWMVWHSQPPVSWEWCKLRPLLPADKMLPCHCLALGRGSGERAQGEVRGP